MLQMIQRHDYVGDVSVFANAKMGILSSMIVCYFYRDCRGTIFIRGVAWSVFRLRKVLLSETARSAVVKTACLQLSLDIHFCP